MTGTAGERHKRTWLVCGVACGSSGPPRRGEKRERRAGQGLLPARGRGSVPLDQAVSSLLPRWPFHTQPKAPREAPQRRPCRQRPLCSWSSELSASTPAALTQRRT